MVDIEGYEGLYGITSCGRVWSYRSKKFLKPRIRKDGYIQAVLYKDGISKPYMVHRLVAKAYIPNPQCLPFVNHKDEVKDHNWINNLEWCDRVYNARYGTAIERANQKKYKKVRCIETGQVFNSFKEAEQELNLYKGALGSYFHRNQKETCGYSFELI